MTRVLHVTRDLPPRTRGGISTAVGGLMRASALPCAAVSFDGWRPRGGGGGMHREGDVVRVDGPDALAGAREFARAWRPDLVCVHHGMLWEFARDLGAPTLLYVHVVQEALRRARGLDAPTGSERAQAVALREADALAVPSEAAASLLASVDAEAAARALVLPLGVEPPVEPATERDPDRVLCVGRFDALKGTADVLAIVEPLVRARPGTVVELVGGLPDSPKSERRWLRRWEVGPDARAALDAPGWLDRRELARRLRRAAVVLAPSYQETFGLAVLEAQAHGCAVVASDIPAHRERIRPGLSGILMPVGSRGELLEATLSLLEDPRNASVLGARAAKEAEGSWWSARVGAHDDAWCALGT